MLSFWLKNGLEFSLTLSFLKTVKKACVSRNTHFLTPILDCEQQIINELVIRLGVQAEKGQEIEQKRAAEEQKRRQVNCAHDQAWKTAS